MPYPVCVHQDGNGSLGAVIPDFPGCFSGADDWRTTLPRMVQEAIKVYCEGEDLEIPAPSSLDELRGNPDTNTDNGCSSTSTRVLRIPGRSASTCPYRRMLYAKLTPVCRPTAATEAASW